MIYEICKKKKVLWTEAGHYLYQILQMMQWKQTFLFIVDCFKCMFNFGVFNTAINLLSSVYLSYMLESPFEGGSYENPQSMLE